MSTNAADYERNNSTFAGYWSGPARRRHRLSYPAITKVRRIRPMLSKRGLDRKPGIAVFEQGFGPGDMLFSFDPSATIAGVEISQIDVDTAAAEARERGFTKIDLRQFVPGKPLPQEWLGRFDVLISSHVLEHIEDPVPVMKELATMMKPGAVACVIVPLSEKAGEDPNHFHRFTEATFRQMLESSGLVVEEMHSVDRLWRALCPIFLRRLGRPYSIWRVLSVLLNAACSPLPSSALAGIDSILGVLGVPPGQCFAWCRKP
jgi:SAM-dependent methyltransferase